MSKYCEKIGNKKLVFRALTGVGAGLANGLFGGGGGMIVVPMLIFLLKYEQKEAHATAILIILPLCLTSGLFYLAMGVSVGMLIPTTLGVIVGGVLGAFLLSKLSNKWVGVVFSIFMAAAGVKMLLF